MKKEDITEFLKSKGYIEYRKNSFAMAEDIIKGNRIKENSMRFKIQAKSIKLEKCCHFEHNKELFWLNCGTHFFGQLSINPETGKLRVKKQA